MTATPSEAPPLDRARFFAEADHLGGRALVDGWTAHVDRWLAGLFEAAVAGGEETGGEETGGGLALVAVGGYGRGELCPASDLDVLLLHAGGRDAGEVATRLWYPMWDEGQKVGHAVRTVRDALALASEDLDTATSLLEVRHLAGDPALTAELGQRARAAWAKRGRRWLARLAESVEARHARAGEVAFHLEPDLKAGRGGLRDVHALGWAGHAHQVLLDDDPGPLDRAYELLLAARVALHRRTGRATDVLTLQEQDGVAADLGPDLGFDGADELMARVAAAGRAIAWRSDETWYRVRSGLAGPGWARSRRDRHLAPGVVLRDGEVHLAADADPAGDPALALVAAAEAAGRGTRIDRDSLARLAAAAVPFPEPWPDRARAALVDLLRAGHDAVPVIEALDQLGIWCRVLPEWETVRSRPQRNAYHRFTVDRHLCECAANAAGLVHRVDRPDLLVLGALLHDIGKGRPGDHTEVGIELVTVIGARLGLAPADVDTLVAMVRHHLLLPDVATRRDLADAATIAAVAAAVGDVSTLRLLDALTEADSLATGPAAWGRWKAGLVAELVDRTAEALGGRPATGDRPAPFPTDEHRALLAAGQPVVRGAGDTLTVVAPDRPGLFSRVAGVLALHGLGVLSADATASEGGPHGPMALEHVRVQPSRAEPVDWGRVTADLERALAGRLAVQSRLAERARTYARRHAPPTTPPRLLVDNQASATATVVEVHAADSIGLLYRITRALAELDLDIRSAKVQTLGDAVVDAFYVRGADSAKITDPAHLDEIERAVLHALTDG